MNAKEIKELERAIDSIWDLALEFGLEPFPTHFEIVPAEIMYEFGSYHIPGHYSHWTHGKAYHKQKTMYDYGLSKIYELVINTDPCRAFLLDSNSLLANKMIVAHVLAHNDFFKNNIYFAKTNRRMVETAEAHADRIRQHEFDNGHEEVEFILDTALSIQHHTDQSIVYPHESRPIEAQTARRTPYDDLFDLDSKQTDDEPRRLRKPKSGPDSDLIRFIIQHAPDLEDWEQDILGIVRNEAIYFAPQMRTKIANEGWATIWHRRIMQSLELSASEVMEFSQLHAGVLAPPVRSINPYYVGSKILEDIESRFDLPKLFEIRELESDASLLRTYLTQELIEKLDLYLFAKQDDGYYTVTDTFREEWEIVRDRLANIYASFDQPVIVAADGDYMGRRELLLRHVDLDRELDPMYAERTTMAVARLWKRPVYLHSNRDGKPVQLKIELGERPEWAWR